MLNALRMNASLCRRLHKCVIHRRKELALDLSKPFGRLDCANGARSVTISGSICALVITYSIPPLPGIIQGEVAREAGRKCGRADFRHTYSSWLDSTSAPSSVQQKLMRHARDSTTMNVYGNALMMAKREANSKVAKVALGSA